MSIENQCESLDRLWLEKRGSHGKTCAKSNHPTIQIVFSIRQNLVSNLDKMSQNCAFCDLKRESQHMRYLIAHILLPGHMLPRGERSLEVTVNLAVGKERKSTMLEQ